MRLKSEKIGRESGIEPETSRPMPGLYHLSYSRRRRLTNKQIFLTPPRLAGLSISKSFVNFGVLLGELFRAVGVALACLRLVIVDGRAIE
jgi:hypothetical protein